MAEHIYVSVQCCNSVISLKERTLPYFHSLNSTWGCQYEERTVVNMLEDTLNISVHVQVKRINRFIAKHILSLSHSNSIANKMCRDMLVYYSMCAFLLRKIKREK